MQRAPTWRILQRHKYICPDRATFITIFGLVLWILDQFRPKFNSTIALPLPTCSKRFIMTLNPLMHTLKAHSNGPLYSNMVIGTLAVDGWAVTFGTRRGLGRLRPYTPSHPCCTECNSPPINGQCTNFILFDVVL